MTKTALITGVTGQDGSYLAELLLSKGYCVEGLSRRRRASCRRIESIWRNPRFRLHHGDVIDGEAVANLVTKVQPDEIYNLAAQSRVSVSFEQPVYTFQVVGIGAFNVLQAACAMKEQKPVRVFQASSSEIFGDARESPQSEKTPLNPKSPYGRAKAYAHRQVMIHRKAYGLFASNGILFNHESERRGEEFVTRKITRAAARIKLKLQDKLRLGNLDAERDWGYARDYAEGMWRILQHDEPGDFVLATGRTATVRDFCRRAFAQLDLDYADHVETDSRFFRPSESSLVRGDATKAKRLLGWEATTRLEDVVRAMVEHDLEIACREAREESSSTQPSKLQPARSEPANRFARPKHFRRGSSFLEAIGRCV